MTQSIDYTLLGMLIGGIVGLIATVVIHIGLIGEFLAIGMLSGGLIGIGMKYMQPRTQQKSTS